MTSFPQLNFFDSLCLCRVSLASHTIYYGDHLPNLSDSYIPPAFVIMPRLGTVKKRTTAKKAKKATTSAKSTKSTKSTSTQSPNDDTAVDPDNVVKAEPEPETGPPKQDQRNSLQVPIQLLWRGILIQECSGDAGRCQAYGFEGRHHAVDLSLTQLELELEWT
jgi:hypothetical protein